MGELQGKGGKPPSSCFLGQIFVVRVPGTEMRAPGMGREQVTKAGEASPQGADILGEKG